MTTTVPQLEQWQYQLTLEDNRIPLVIGVTGHCDLRPGDIPKLEHAVRTILDDLHHRYPHTPMVLLSPLAEGADRLVARVAREMAREHRDALDIRLVVPLPMPLEEYARDFHEANSRRIFDQLSAGATTFVLPLVTGTDPDMRQRESRDRQYAAVGAYIARHSQILIALWDHQPATSICGTAAVVDFKLSGIPEPYAAPPAMLDTVENGPVYHIMTPRARQTTEPHDAFLIDIVFPKNWQGDAMDEPKWQTLVQAWCRHRLESPWKGTKPVRWALLRCVEGLEYLQHRGTQCLQRYRACRPGPWKRATQEQWEEQYNQTLKRIDLFNADVRALRRRSADFLNSRRCLLTDEATDAEVLAALPHTARYLVDRYAVADALARRYQRRRQGSLCALFCTAVLSSAAFELYAHWLKAFTVYQWSLDLYPAILFVAYLLYLHARRMQWQQKHLDYRALAEGMRVQFFWTLAGINDDVAANYLRQQRSELDWIRFAIRTWNFPLESGDLSTFGSTALEPPHEELFPLMRVRWVNAQAEYFSRNARSRHDAVKLYEFGTKVFVFLAIGTAIAVSGAHHLHAPATEAAHSGLLDVFKEELPILLMGFSPIVAAALAGYAEKLAFSAEAKQFQRMVDIFMIAANQFSHALLDARYQDARALLRELGKQALEENGNWVMLHRERPMEMPVG